MPNVTVPEGADPLMYVVDHPGQTADRHSGLSAEEHGMEKVVALAWGPGDAESGDTLAPPAGRGHGAPAAA
jgi:hypothetical protein